MNFIIVGSGAIGSYIGGRLAAAGQLVSLVARPYQLEALQGKALRVTDLDGFAADVPSDQLHLALDFQTAYAKLSPAARANTIALLCVKGGATSRSAAEIAACIDAGTIIISLQNGVENVARIQAAAPQAQVLAGMVPYNVVMKTSSHVHRATPGMVQLESSAHSNEIAARFNAAGIKIGIAKDMKNVQWGKLLLNLNNPINALSNLPLLDELLDRNFRVVWATLQQEALSAMTCEGIVPVQLVAASPKAMTRILRLPNFIFTRLTAKMLRMDAAARSSMWDDVQRGRITEIDDLCGAVVRLAAKHGKAAPVNAKMCELVASLQKGDTWTGQQLRRALAI
ncbi:MAG: 2-dehydropantoate 2-reductase [Cytophagales bacterium]|nr:2-dehydropantoate 2-reductase [Cytophagales bacterium]